MAYSRKTFAGYTADMMTELLREICVQTHISVQVTVTFADIIQSAVDITFFSDMSITVIAPASFASPERRDYFTNHWVACFRLFVAAKERRRDLVGSCRLWNDDYPSGSGLCFSGNSVSQTAIPDPVFMESDGYAKLRRQCELEWQPWATRHSQVFWRGASTGMRNFLRVSRWQDIPRFRLCLEAREHGASELLDIGINHIAQIWDENERAEIVASDMMRPPVPLMGFMNYKHSIDIDGNTCSWTGLFSKLLMGNTVVKVDSELGWRQWYYHRLVPWKNFIPISADCKELLAVAEWLLRQPNEAREIAEQGRLLAMDITFDNAIEQAVQLIQQTVCEFKHPH